MNKKILEYLAEIIKPWEEYNLGEVKPFGREMVKVLLKKLYHWSQREYAIRYIPALKYIKTYPKDASILDVGSGPLGISLYTKRKIVGVDIAIQGPHYNRMLLIKSNAESLPFKNNAFDLVLSLDMLEHTPKQLRQDIITEMLRVSRKGVFLGMPCGQKAEKWERKCRQIYEHILSKRDWSERAKDKFKSRNKFLLEHYSCGLPKEEEIKMYIDEYRTKHRRRVKVKILDNESVYVWYYWMLGAMKYSYLRWVLTTIFFIVFFPILSRINWGGCYRKIFIIEKVF